MKKTIVKLMEYRCSMYYVLQNVYQSEPTVDSLMETIQMCKKYDLDNAVDLLKEEEAFITYFKTLNKRILTKDIESIQSEYARLFWGPRKVVAPPFESIYRSKKKIMFQEHTDQVKNYYKNAGIKIETKDHLPADFIGYQLEFMYVLSHRLTLAIKNDDFDQFEKILKYQQSFLDQHLTKWTPAFSTKIVEGSDHELFTVVSTYLDAFIQEDLKLLQTFQ